MKLLRDFTCDDCYNSEERFIDSDITEYKCKCGGTMKRIIGMPKVALDGTDPGFPGAYEKWGRVREQRAEISRKKSYYEG